MDLARSTRMLGALAVAGAIAIVATAPLGTRAADHLDGPTLLAPPGGNLRADINDVYVFRAADPERTVLALTTHPAAGFVSPLDYATNVDYVIDIDRNGDAVEDLAYVFRFGAMSAGSQPYTVTLYTGKHARTLTKGHQLGRGTTGRSVELKDDARVFVGLRSDPFFFDLGGFLSQVAGVNSDQLGGVLPVAGRKFCDANKNDFFKVLNTNAIVLEVPNEALVEDFGDEDAAKANDDEDKVENKGDDDRSSNRIGVWARTIGPVGAGRGQIDRMGRPAINTVFNKGAAKTTFNQQAPTADRANFETSFRTTLEHFGYDAATAKAIAEILLPDILTYDVGTMADGTALNGRAPADDVIDAELGIVTKGAIKTDCIGPHTDYTATFPYLGPPHR